MDYLWATASYIVPFVIVLSVVVFVHEYGHFIVGRLCGIKVDAFSLGFGPELFAFLDKHGTRWRISAIPLGGYVKFHGDANAVTAGVSDEFERMSPQERAVTFAAQPVWKRAAVVFAGPFFNFLLAIALYWGMFSLVGRPLMVDGQLVVAPRISEADPRPRHHGLSHHTATALAFAAPADVIVAVPNDLTVDLTHARGRVVAVEPLGVVARLAAHGLHIESMGRPAAGDQVLFECAAAAGTVAARQLP